jgi:transcriptional regulator
VQEYGFATLISRAAGELVATHLPLLLDPQRGPYGMLLGHMARANGQWQELSMGETALAIFQGPHAYVSPSWYATRPAVPTWNYMVVHAYGVPRLVEEEAELCRILDATVRLYESDLPEPWSLGALPPEYLRKMLAGIVGFEIPIDRLEGKQKLSQNRSPEDQRGVIEHLEAAGDGISRAVARRMREAAGISEAGGSKGG